MRGRVVFVMTLLAALVAVWLTSGEQFLDLVFAMPDLGPVDDVVLTAVVWLEEMKGALGLPDLFADLRATLHDWTGLG